MRTPLLALLLSSIPLVVAGQTWPVDDPVLRRIWELGMQDSHLERIAQPLIDSIGPRLGGTPAHEGAHDWAVDLLRSWGIGARKEVVGPAARGGWERGITHVDLIQPRIRTLEGTLFGLSPGTNGPVEGAVAVVPDYTTYDEYQRWLDSLRGKFVAVSFPEPTCRPEAHFDTYGTAGAADRMRETRDAARREFDLRVRDDFAAYAAAGAAGILRSTWIGEIGTFEVPTPVSVIPILTLSCEDYGLVYRLATHAQGPVLRVDAEARSIAGAQIVNTLAEIRGQELEEEYVILSAHMDSFDPASGAVDNGSGVVTMLEAMRILQEAYPAPKRTIMLGLWGFEELGLLGSRGFVAANPGIVENIQIVLNQDSGTGRTTEISGYLGAEAQLSAWLARLPAEISRETTLAPSSTPRGGSDHQSFIEAGAPGIAPVSTGWSYSTTWHTNRDTYDKLVFEELRSNAVLFAMLAYLASEDPERVPRERTVAPTSFVAGIATVEVASGRSLQTDEGGAYRERAGEPGVISRVGNFLTVCTWSATVQTCAGPDFPGPLPPEPAERHLILDLSAPVVSSGALQRGTVRPSAVRIFADGGGWAVGGLPLGEVRMPNRVEVRFALDGSTYALHFGPRSEWPSSAVETTAASIVRESPSTWKLRSGPESMGRLWDVSDPSQRRDLGLYELDFELTFRTGGTEP